MDFLKAFIILMVCFFGFFAFESFACLMDSERASEHSAAFIGLFISSCGFIYSLIYFKTLSVLDD